jgi:hypothetical protein
MNPVSDIKLENSELWRRQRARNLMDCYALGMETLMRRPGDRALDALTMLMVDGMTSVRCAEDERSFYRTAAGLCRACLERAGEKGRMFGIYAAIFDEMADEEG